MCDSDLSQGRVVVWTGYVFVVVCVALVNGVLHCKERSGCCEADVLGCALGVVFHSGVNTFE